MSVYFLILFTYLEHLRENLFDQFSKSKKIIFGGYKRGRFYKLLISPGIHSEESIPPAYVICRAGTTNRVVIPARQDT